MDRNDLDTIALFLREAGERLATETPGENEPRMLVVVQDLDRIAYFQPADVPGILAGALADDLKHEAEAIKTAFSGNEEIRGFLLAIEAAVLPALWADPDMQIVIHEETPALDEARA